MLSFEMKTILFIYRFIVDFKFYLKKCSMKNYAFFFFVAEVLVRFFHLARFTHDASSKFESHVFVVAGWLPLFLISRRLFVLSH